MSHIFSVTGHIGPKYHLEKAVIHNKLFFMGHIMLYINKSICHMGLLNMDLKMKKVEISP